MAHTLVPSSRNLLSVPIFLAPAFSTTIPLSTNARSFSYSSPVRDQVQRGNRDKNRKRGVSAIRSTGPRNKLSVTRLGPLPKPVADPTEARATFEVDPNHGLWGFFNSSKEAIIPPVEEDSYGRSWTKDELAKKGWQDLHKLYWVCVKETNIVRTRNNERKRLRAGYGIAEGEDRIKTLSETMRNIRGTLTERHYAHFDALRLLDTKNVYELFPEILHRHVQRVAPEILETESDLREDTLSFDDSPLLDSNVSLGSYSAQDQTNQGDRGQLRRLPKQL